ncbi:hypothetical protein Cri9333_2807 [Crinalium epipsammum PCC 9333]|uniref:Uncharacterized protein n=1 Tax=Crinalium epipsammum PCC 9333 TaxID=1173022 RepID=K9VZV2_9CYAN|nr:hypothetical protein [Crinalium epipsammum]AFZ13653.1 hypothetical protein Cri9333_2807 [Crinalium epipsammum PCC 9333]
MKKNKQLSMIAAVTLALGASAILKFPSFSETTALAAIAVDTSNSNNQATIPNGGKFNVQTKLASLGPVQSDDDSYLAESVGKCGARQASGGQKGDRRTIKFPARTGNKTIQIAYEMLRIPDKLQVIHKGKVILDTGFVSGSKVRSLSFNQSPKELTVILRGNPTQSGTRWTYIVGCPK